MAKLFISYRREDSAVVAGRICDRLQAHFGALPRRQGSCTVRSREQKKRFLRLLRGKPEAAKVVLEALQNTAADPDSDEYLKKSAATAMSLLQAA